MTTSKAAMRAAHEIAKSYGSVGGNYTRDAEIIDREFADILTICREISQWSHRLDDGAYDGGLGSEMQEKLDAILERHC